MTDHISSAEWIEYLSSGPVTSERLKLFARVHAHIGACEACRALHEASIRAKEALPKANAEAVSGAIPTAYQAVAAQPAPEADEILSESDSMLAVPFEYDGSTGRFQPEHLICTGDAERYVFLSNADYTRLTDDFDEETFLAIENGMLHVQLPDAEGPTAELNAADGSKIEASFDSEGILNAALPAPGRYVLTILLH